MAYNRCSNVYVRTSAQYPLGAIIDAKLPEHLPLLLALLSALTVGGAYYNFNMSNAVAGAKSGSEMTTHTSTRSAMKSLGII